MELNQPDLITPGTGRTVYQRNVFENGEVLPETIRVIKEAYRLSIPQTKKLAEQLKGQSLEESGRNIWNFITGNIRYIKDLPGTEQIRTAARSWADRFTGVDCEDYAILTGALLKNMGYEPRFEIVAFTGTRYQHIYCVGYFRGQSVPIDPTPYGDGAGPPVAFNTRPAGITATMEIELLNGLPGMGSAPSPAPAFSGFGGTWIPTPVTRSLMNRQSEMITKDLQGLGDASLPPAYRLNRMAIMLNGLPEQVALLAGMEFIQDIDLEGNFIFKPGVDPYLVGELMGVAHAWAVSGADPEMNLIDLNGVEGVEFDMEAAAIEGLGDVGKLKVGKWLNRQKDKIRKTVDKTKVGRFVTKRVDKALNTANKAAKWTSQNVAKGVKTFVKNPLHFINRFNPATVVVRNAVLAALRLNLFKMSSRLKYGYYTEEQAKTKGFNLDEWRKLRKQITSLENIFDKLGGKQANLREVIIKGGKGLNGLGDPATASTAAATPIIVKIISALKAINFEKLFNRNRTPQEMEETDVPAEISPAEVTDQTQPTEDPNSYNSPDETDKGQEISRRDASPGPYMNARQATEETKSDTQWLPWAMAAGFAALMMFKI